MLINQTVDNALVDGKPVKKTKIASDETAKPAIEPAKVAAPVTLEKVDPKPRAFHAEYLIIESLPITLVSFLFFPLAQLDEHRPAQFKMFLSAKLSVHTSD